MKEKFSTDIEMTKTEKGIQSQQKFCINCFKYKQYPRVIINPNELLNFLNSDETKHVFNFETEIEFEPEV
jgi:hypothetical protein